MAIGILLIVVAALWRVAGAFVPGGAFSNFAPLMALALCGGLFLPRVWAWVIPLAALLISDFILDLHYGVPFLTWMGGSVYACYAVMIMAGIGLRRNPRLPLVFGAALLSSLLFYGVTDTVAWAADPGYAKDAAGWFQALTTGLPGYPPTWTFFRNSAASDLLFTGLYIGAMALTGSRLAGAESLPAGRMVRVAVRS